MTNSLFFINVALRIRNKMDDLKKYIYGIKGCSFELKFHFAEATSDGGCSFYTYE